MLVSEAIEQIDEEELCREVDEAMEDFVSDDELEEYGSLYEAYWETCDGEAGAQVIQRLIRDYELPDTAETYEELKSAFDFLNT